MKKFVSIATLSLIVALILSVFACPALAEEAVEAADSATPVKAVSAAAAIAIVAGAGALAMSMAISKSVDAISRQPEAEGPIRTSMMLGLVFVETAIIYALIVAILIIFVL